jgi:hypothetical protein
VGNAGLRGGSRLLLRPGGYDWQFVEMPGGGTGWTDAGSAGCHGRPDGAAPPPVAGYLASNG